MGKLYPEEGLFRPAGSTGAQKPETGQQQSGELPSQEQRGTSAGTVESLQSGNDEEWEEPEEEPEVDALEQACSEFSFYDCTASHDYQKCQDKRTKCDAESAGDADGWTGAPPSR
eukprot:1719280-Rhodomonas_salina.1